MIAGSVYFVMVFAFIARQEGISSSGLALAAMLTLASFCCVMMYAWVRHYTCLIDKTSGSKVVGFVVGALAALTAVFYDLNVLRDPPSAILCLFAGLWFAAFRNTISEWLAHKLPLDSGNGAALLRRNPPSHVDDLSTLKVMAWAIFVLPVLAKFYWRAWT